MLMGAIILVEIMSIPDRSMFVTIKLSRALSRICTESWFSRFALNHPKTFVYMFIVVN